MGNAAVLVNNQWSEGSGKPLVSHNPFNGESLWQGNSAGQADVDSAVSAARTAFKSWGRISLQERIELTRRFQQQLKANTEELANAIGQETGKPLWESRTEIAAMIGKIDISINAYEVRTGEGHSETAAGKAALRHRPHGVVAVFGPYNFPGHLPNGHIVPALLAGNCVVFKPSELCPLVAEKTVKLWVDAGLPEGVINLVQGERETGQALAQNEDIDGLFFTGSSATGKILHEGWGGRPDKILALEMGGNNPLIVEDDVPLDGTLHHLLFSSFVSAGQRCTCARRVFIPDSDFGDTLVSKLAGATRALTVGAYDAEPQPFMGCLVSEISAKGIVQACEQLLSLGASPIVELEKDSASGAIIRPTIVDVTGINAPDEEVFGPLMQVIRYSDFDSAMEQANNTRFGLAAGLISNSETRWQQFLLESRAGIVNWNKPLTGASSAAPFGGIGASGNHRPSAYYAADYCAYPVASMESYQAEKPATLPPGMVL
jgi:succinylglutamic semialdehyde dehydrogenase